MTVEIPDVRIHDLCFGCKQWFFPEDGTHIELRKKTGVGRLQRVGDLWTGVDRTSRFLCCACQEKRKRRKLIITVMILIVVLLITVAGLIFIFMSGILDEMGSV